MTLGLSISTPSSPVESGNAEHSMDTTWFHKYLQHQENTCFTKQQTKTQGNAQEVNRTSSNDRLWLPVHLCSCTLLGSKLGQSISMSLTKDGNESFITRVIPDGIQKFCSNFLNGRFLKSVYLEKFIIGRESQVVSGGQVSSFHNPGVADVAPRCVRSSWW